MQYYSNDVILARMMAHLATNEVYNVIQLDCQHDDGDEHEA